MTKKYIEAQNLPEGEKVYLKKGIFGWRVIYPISNEDGSWNLKNLIFGNIGDFIMWAVIIGLLLWHVKEDATNMQAAYDLGNQACLTVKAIGTNHLFVNNATLP